MAWRQRRWCTSSLPTTSERPTPRVDLFCRPLTARPRASSLRGSADGYPDLIAVQVDEDASWPDQGVSVTLYRNTQDGNFSIVDMAAIGIDISVGYPATDSGGVAQTPVVGNDIKSAKFADCEPSAWLESLLLRHRPLQPDRS